MEFQILREAGEELITSAQIVYVNFDKQTQSSRPIPEGIRRHIESFEGIIPPQQGE
jgi:acyl-CoA thioesterase FadM